jgi:hypothetical protein
VNRAMLEHARCHLFKSILIWQNRPSEHPPDILKVIMPYVQALHVAPHVRSPKPELPRSGMKARVASEPEDLTEVVLLRSLAKIAPFVTSRLVALTLGAAYVYQWDSGAPLDVEQRAVSERVLKQIRHLDFHAAYLCSMPDFSMFMSAFPSLTTCTFDARFSFSFLDGLGPTRYSPLRLTSWT